MPRLLPNQTFTPAEAAKLSAPTVAALLTAAVKAIRFVQLKTASEGSMGYFPPETADLFQAITRATD